MREYANYSDLLLAVENTDDFTYELYYENAFSVVREKGSGRWFYFEEGENDASDFFEVTPIAELIMPHDIDIDTVKLYGMFDCICCGENVDSDGKIHFLWFEKPKVKIGVYEDVRDWYTRSFPDDDLGPCINSLTFKDLYESLKAGNDVYKTLGAGASVVRERCFKRLASLYEVDYGAIYDMWLGEHSA